MEERINNQSWVRLPLCLLADERLTRADIIIVAILIDKTDARGFVKLSLEKLAQVSGVSLSTAKRSIKRLQDYGYIYWDRTGRESIYTLLNTILPPKKRSNSKQQSEKQKLEFDKAGLKHCEEDYEVFLNKF